MGTVILADVTELETVKISELPVATAVGDAASLPTVSIGKTKKIAKSNLLKNLNIPLDNVLHVAKNGNDGNAGTIGDPLLTIQAAIDFAIANLPASPGIVSIIVYPGTYEEQITNTDSRIYISGSTFAPQCIETYCTLLHPTILYNTGADAAHYPFTYTGASVLNLSNMTIKVDDGNVFGEFSNIMFDKCYFSGGHFIEYLGSGGKSLEFINCVCYCDLFDLSGTAGDRFIYFHATYLFGTGAMNFGSTGGVYSKNIRITLTIISNNVLIGGDWSLEAYIFNMLYDGVLRFDTTGNVIMDISEQRNGIHFISNPSGIKSISNANFSNYQIASDHRDITADVPITDVIYIGNIQQNGICDCIQITNPEKSVGAGAMDRYYDLQSAITSIPAASEGTVKIFENQSGLAELTLPHENVNITINGQKQYSLAFTSDIVEIGANRKIRFADISQLSGGNIQLNGATAELSLESCQYVTGYITLTAGAFAILYKSSFFGSTGKAAIYIDSLDTIVVVGYSRVQGSAGQPAVEFSVDADNKFKAKYSSFIHGDKDASEPIVNTAVGKVDFSIYLCGLNAPWNAAKFTNLIGSAGNATDVNINF